MFWLLLMLMFRTDGTTDVQTFQVSSELACHTKAQQLTKDISASRPDDLGAIGLKCDGPFTSPLIPSKGA